MSEQDRNPSPPPEILNDDLLPDRISDTAYSKKWTIKTLMNIVQACDKKNEAPNKSADSGDSSNEVNTDIVELDSKIEEDACTLWDMSASKPVATFLFEAGVCNIFLDIIDKTKSPRLLEIIVGILGNIATFNRICQSISENKTLVNMVLLLSGTTDTPSLIQVFRLIICGIKNQNCQELWFEAFKESPFFMDNIKDILSNSLSCTVILATYQLLFTILTENIYYSEIWGQELFMTSIIVAGQQLFKKKECLDNFFCVFNSLCQCTPNVDRFVKKWDELKPLFYEYIDSLGKEECLFDSKRISSVYSYFDAYNTLLSSGLMEPDSILADMDTLIPMARISGAVNNLVANVRKHNLKVVDLQNPEPEDANSFLRRVEERNGTQYITMMTHYEFHTWNVLAETIIELAKTLQSFEKVEGKDILEDIVNSDVANENIGVLII